MNGAIAIFKRETAAYFTTPLGWLILMFFLFIFGFFFALSVTAFMDYASQMGFNPQADLNVNSFVIQGLFGNMAVVILLIAPGLVMRLLAEDRKQKSIELLLTSPISSVEIVMGKFFGALSFVGAMMAATLPYMALLYAYGEPDTGVLLSNYLSLFLLTASLVAVNLFLSSFTENQIIAFISGFAFNLIFWILGWAADLAPAGAAQDIFQGLAMGSHYMEMGKGLIRMQDLVYFLTFIAFFLLGTTQRVEALRWR